MKNKTIRLKTGKSGETGTKLPLFGLFFDRCSIRVYYKNSILTASELLERDGFHFKGQRFAVDIIKRKNVYTPILRWSKNAPQHLVKIEFLLDEEIPGSWSFFKNGYQSWTVTRSYKPGEIPLTPRKPWYFPFVNPVAAIQDNMNNLPSGKPFAYNSESFVMLKKHDTDTCEFAGVGGDFRDFVYFHAGVQRDQISFLKIIYDYDHFRLPANRNERMMEPVIVDNGFEETVFASYFDGIRKRKSLTLKKKIPVGWCSWYYYFQHIRINDIISNLEVCKKKKLKLDYFQIDDGWQRSVGDWLEMQPEFDGRMKFLAGEIHKAGYHAGIWIAPFSALVSSNIFKKHPDWFIRDSASVLSKMKAYAGYNPLWGGFFTGLDITHPGAEEYVRRVIRTAVKEWGYDVLKLDFLYSAALSGKCHDNSLTRAERMLKALSIIREEAGPKTFILGCGIPIMQGIGYVDGNRISGDVAPFWTGKDEADWGGESHVGTRNALRNTLNRSAMHKRLWLNDPDCLMIRETDTELSAGEIKMLKDVICVSNGMLVISDNLELLPEEKMQEIRDAFAFSGRLNKGRVYTLGIMKESHPGFLLNTAGVLLALNFNDKETVVRIDKAQLDRIFKLNRRKTPGKFNGENGIAYTPFDLQRGITLPGRSSILLNF